MSLAGAKLEAAPGSPSSGSTRAAGDSGRGTGAEGSRHARAQRRMSRRHMPPPPASSSLFSSSRKSDFPNRRAGGSNNRPESRAASSAQGMSTAPVTCRVCGCLNFSSLDLCDACRSSRPGIPVPSVATTTTPTALQFTARRTSPWSSRRESPGGNARRAERAEEPARPRAGKRARSEGQAEQAADGADHEVIDLISDEDEPMPERMARRRAGGAQRGPSVPMKHSVQASDIPPRPVPGVGADPEIEIEETKKEVTTLFMSRVFGSVAFIAEDFPTEAEANAARRNHAAAAAAARARRAEAAPGSTTPAVHTAAADGQRPVVADSGAGATDSTDAVAGAPPSSEQEPSLRSQSTSSSLPSTEAEKTEPSTETEKTEPSPPVPPPLAAEPPLEESTAPFAPSLERQQVRDEEEEQRISAPWMSRVFDTVTFRQSDFPVVPEGPSAARRSHPPRPPAPTSVTTSDVASAASLASPDGAATASVGAVGQSDSAALTATTPPMSAEAASSPRRADAAPPREPPAPPSPQVKLEPAALASFYHQVQKPSALGECSAEFLMFMKECGGESYVEDDEEWRQQQLQMMDVVDLTNLSDSEGEGDSDDDFVILGVSRDGYASAPVLSNGGSVVNGASATAAEGARPASAAAASSSPAAAFVAGAVPEPPKPAAMAVLAECMICGERRSVRTMTRCPKCSQYYHTRCARDIGGAVRCWECEPDEFIDDSELTQTAHEEAVSMLRAFRQDSSPSDEDGEDGEDEQLEDEGTGGEAQGGEAQGDDMDGELADGADSDGDNPLMSGRPTRSERRWSSFVNDATAPLESHFREVTARIEREMATSEGRARYSKGFATRESFNAGMNRVVSRFVELERENARAIQQAQAQAQAQAQERARAQAEALAHAQAQAQAQAPFTADVPVAPAVDAAADSSRSGSADAAGAGDLLPTS